MVKIMQENNKNKAQNKSVVLRSAKECAYVAVFVALVIAVQLALSFVPGVELVTVLFVSYSMTMGVRRGVISATAFSLLRQLVFGFNPTVLLLYLIYFNFLTVVFGVLGKKLSTQLKTLPLIVLIACVSTALFTMTDNILTPLIYNYGERATRAYFTASLPFMISQVICSAVSVTLLLLPLTKVFSVVKSNLTKNQ